MPKSRAVPEKDSEVTLQAQFTGYEFPCTLAFLIKPANIMRKLNLDNILSIIETAVELKKQEITHLL